MKTDKIIKVIQEVHEQFKARGNWGHSGRPGKVGGSVSGRGAGLSKDQQMVIDTVGSLVGGRDSGKFMVSDMDAGQLGRTLRSNGYQQVEETTLNGRNYQTHVSGNVKILHRDRERYSSGKGWETLNGSQIMFVDANTNELV